MQPVPRSAMAIYGMLTSSLFAACSAAPSPLYRLYQQEFQLLPIQITVIFGSYVVTLLAALLIAGRLSDHLGRKPVIAAALAVNLGAMLLFMRADSFEALVFARLAQGVGVGLSLPVCGAAIVDANPRLGPTLNAITPFMGLTFGVLGAGTLVGLSSAPLLIPYEVAAGLTALSLVALVVMPETAVRRPGALRSLVPQMAVPPAARGMLMRVMPVVAGGWALGGLYMSLMPGLIADATGIHAPWLGSVVIGVLMSMAATAVLWGRSMPALRALGLGGTALVVGVGMTMIGIATGLPAALFAGAVAGGLGQGLVFSSVLRLLMPLAHEHDRAGLLSAFFVLSYLSFAGPVIVAGAMVPHLGLVGTVLAYGAWVIALAVISAISLRRPVLTPCERPV